MKKIDLSFESVNESQQTSSVNSCFTCFTLVFCYINKHVYNINNSWDDSFTWDKALDLQAGNL